MTLKKIFISGIILFNLLFVAYLLAPVPELPPLTDSVRSDLPGDTVQLQNVSAYFTNLSRTEVMTFYRANYNAPFRKFLNHPPEKARDLIVDTIQTYYLEEIIFPFKQSVFVNGYDWQNDVFTKPEKRIANKLIFKDVEYQSKITLKVYPTTIAQRLGVFFGIELIIAVILYIYFRLIPRLRP